MKKEKLGTLLLMVLWLACVTGCGGGAGRVVIAQQPGPVSGPSAPPAPLPGSLTGGLPGGPDAGTVVSGTVGAALDGIAAAHPGFSGSVLVAKGGQVLLSKGYGGVGPDQLWDWASVGKQFTAAAMCKLQMQGKLRLDDPVSRFFPGCPADKSQVTLRHLLSHTTGIEHREPLGDDMQLTREGVVKYFYDTPVLGAPGTRWDYNNLGYEVAAAVVEVASGTTMERYIIDNLMRPAGMRTATFKGQPDVDTTRMLVGNRGQGQMFPDGPQMSWGYRGSAGAILPPREMLAWDTALRGNTILDAAAKADLYRVVQQDYALGWFVTQKLGDTCIDHDGLISGFSYQFVRLQNSGVTVIVAANYEDPRNYDFALQLAQRAQQSADVAQARGDRLSSWERWSYRPEWMATRSRGCWALAAWAPCTPRATSVWPVPSLSRSFTRS